MHFGGSGLRVGTFIPSLADEVSKLHSMVRESAMRPLVPVEPLSFMKPDAQPQIKNPRGTWKLQDMIEAMFVTG